MFKAFIAAAALLAAAGFAPNASAAVVLSDNFNGEALGLNYAGFANWNVTGGTVDLIGDPGPYVYYPGNGRYVDLDGSTFQVGQMTSKESFAAGTYTLHFDLGGNTTGALSKTTEIDFGTFSKQITLASGAGLNHYAFTVHTTGPNNLIFSELGRSDNQGNILDNVSLASGVPELATWAMMIIGFGGVGFQLRRRGNAAAATA